MYINKKYLVDMYTHMLQKKLTVIVRRGKGPRIIMWWPWSYEIKFSS